MALMRVANHVVKATLWGAAIAIATTACGGSLAGLSSSPPSGGVATAHTQIAWVMPSQLVTTNCFSEGKEYNPPIEHRPNDSQGLDRLSLEGPVASGAILHAFLYTKERTPLQQEITAPATEGIALDIPKLNGFTAWVTDELTPLDSPAPGPLATLDCTFETDPPTSTPAVTQPPTPTSTSSLAVISLGGYECYTGPSVEFWDDTRTVLKLVIKNLSSTKSKRVWLRVKTDRGGPLTKFRALNNVSKGNNLGGGSENSPTDLVFQGVTVAGGGTVSFRWQADYFWNPGTVSVEAWEGDASQGETLDIGSSAYFVSSTLKSCSRY